MKKIFAFIISLFMAGILYAQIIDTVQFANWINENSIELNNTNDSGFVQLIDVLRNKSVIGLGECVHGSKTINNLRIDIAKALIENSNFKNIAFEMSFNTGLRINHFLQTGDGNIEQILRESHFFINSNEMLKFILWMRNYNENANRKLNLYGFDIQSNIDLVQDLLPFYAKVDEVAGDLTTSLIEIFTKNKMSSFGEYSNTLQDSVLKIVNSLAEKHTSNKKNYILNADFIEYEYSGKRIEVLSHYLQLLNSGYAQSIKMRDSCNAELVKWIKDFEGEESKIVLFAHNGHLANSLRFTPRVRTLSTQGFYEDFPKELITGYYLKKTFGNEYYFIGTQFGNGFFMGFDPKNDFHLSKLEVTSPEPYTFTYLLHQAKKIPYFIDFNFSRSTPREVINYICSLQSFYEIGAAYDFKYAKARLVDYFDGIIYIDKIEASDLLKFE